MILYKQLLGALMTKMWEDIFDLVENEQVLISEKIFHPLKILDDDFGCRMDVILLVF